MAEEELGAAASAGLRRGEGVGWGESGALRGSRAEGPALPFAASRRSPEQKLERKRKVVTPAARGRDVGPGRVRGGARVTPGSAPAAGGEGGRSPAAAAVVCQREVRAGSPT